MLSGLLVPMWVERYPRLSCAATFSVAAILFVAVIWRGDVPSAARLAAVATVTSTLAGAAMGPRVLNRARTPLQSAFVGGATSLLSLLFFSECLAIPIVRGTRDTSGVVSVMLLTPLFALLAVGWAVVIVGVVLGWALRKSLPAQGHADTAA